MGKLTKAAFARAKRALGIKKVTRKNIGRIARKARGIGTRVRKRSRRKARRTTRRKGVRRRGVRRLVRRYRRRRKHGGGKSLQRTAFKFIRLGALAGPGIQSYMTDGNVAKALTMYGGYSWGQGRFEWGTLAKAWGPFLGACVATYGIPKIVSIIRRM